MVMVEGAEAVAAIRYACVALLMAACGSSAPPPSGAVLADMRASVYQDDDNTTIVTATTAVRGRPNAEWTIGARYLVDVTTTASIDVVTAATGRWVEPRHETAGDVAWTDGWTTVSAGYVHSIEEDWESHTGNAGFTQDLDDHNMTIGLGGTFVHNDVWRAGDPTFRRQQLVAGGAASLVLVASPTSIWSFGYTFAWVDGYQASPYRFARFSSSPAAQLDRFVPERHPERRLRHSVVARWNVMLGDSAALRSHMRIYGDDWGLASLTVGTELRADVGDGISVGGMIRGYGQRGADFYEDRYEAPRRYMTGDRELSPFVDVFAGPRLAWSTGPTGPFHELRVELKALGFGFWFFDFSRLPTRYGFVAELAIGGNL